jgi:hypothetical protein
MPTYRTVHTDELGEYYGFLDFDDLNLAKKIMLLSHNVIDIVEWDTLTKKEIRSVLK